MSDLVRELEALDAKATTMCGHNLMRYEHGGGRLVNDSEGTRTLIADFYNAGDREVFYTLRVALPALIEYVKERTPETEAALLAALRGGK